MPFSQPEEALFREVDDLCFLVLRIVRRLVRGLVGRLRIAKPDAPRA
jgi:hypothetical protein